MKFKKGTRRRALEYEQDLVQYWKQHKTFKKSVEKRPKDNAYVFYDGPPFITGSPHHGTLLASTIKDAVPRYWTMKGKRVERVWGWDCHGLPAEVFTEKKLGIHDKRDIGTKVSLEDYINTCRANMVQTGSEWEDIIDRIGRWVDFKGAYKTMDKDFMESVWWAFKQLYESGKIYEGEKVLLYCTRDATPLSKAEIAMDNSYQEDTDPSVYVKLKLKSEPKAVGGETGDESRPLYLLAWTTTPWTLPANTAAAVNPELEYEEFEIEGQRFIIAQGTAVELGTKFKLEAYSDEMKLVRCFRGGDLVGLEYEPLFADRGKNAHKVWAADYVTTDEGTGIVHLAPAYGEEDYALSKALGFPLVIDIDENGFYTEGEWQGQYVWDANKPIAKALHERGVVWRIDYIRHHYPHCYRCNTKLMYRAHPSWFMDINGQRELMLEQNGGINWFPKHLKLGRFAKTVETAPDWNLSRDRFWATAMPVWKGKDKDGREHTKVVGSYEELKELSGVVLPDYHRPWIDDVTFTIDDVEYRRIDKVLDCWFESGSMPFAQFHYPFENREKFEQNFPGDFIAEYVSQVRAWFYYVHAVGVGLFGKRAFNNVVVTGTLLGNDGRKMSKSLNNFTDPNEVMDRFSADSLRFLYLSSPVLAGEDFIINDKDVGDIARKLGMVWNMYDFFTLYADVDGWDSGLKAGELPADPMTELNNPLDQWIVSRVHQLSQEVDAQMQRYDLPNALKPILPFIDDASNWYVRRSRKRFWKSDNDSDKQNAYRTLHYVLVQLSLIMAPFTPFLAEELYRQLTNGESVHLLDWPVVGHVNDLLLKDMAEARAAITLALAQRAEAGIKVRQPLSSLLYTPSRPLAPDHIEFVKEMLREEVNVKEVHVSTEHIVNVVSVTLHTEITLPLRREGLARELIRNVQQARKAAGLEVDDRITLNITSDDEEITTLLKDSELSMLIARETLAEQLTEAHIEGFSTTVNVEKSPVNISLTKSD